MYIFTKIISLSFIIFFTIFFKPILCQIQVTGHIFAEVVDNISIYSLSDDFLNINKNKNIEVGHFKISTNNNPYYSINVNECKFIGDEGTEVIFDTNILFKNQQEFTLSSDVNLFKYDDKNYDSCYNIIISYN